MIRWLLNLLRKDPPLPSPSVAEGDIIVVDVQHDERPARLRSELEQAKRQLSLVEAEVQALRVDTGVIRRNYDPPRRTNEGEGHQPA